MVLFLLLGTATTFAQEKKQKISDPELTKFASIFEKLQTAEDRAQQEMVKVVESEGLDMKRFNEIHIAFINPNMNSNATREELEKHARSMDKIEKMQAKLQVEMDEIVKTSGFSIRKYRKIVTALQENHLLRERYKKLTKKEKK